jgi:hypothetical protein
MRTVFILLVFGMAHSACAQPSPAGMPSKESFVNQVFHTMVDSSFDRYFLVSQADPCGFIQYDYDEWFKYHLLETVPIYILQELAKKCYERQRPGVWQQDSLVKARCITWKQSDSITHPFNDIFHNKTLTNRQRKKVLRQRYKEWEHLPGSDKIFYYFSIPEFTDDGQYAVIDMAYRCDVLCGLGMTYLFRHTASGWKMIGDRLDWFS